MCTISMQYGTYINHFKETIMKLHEIIDNADIGEEAWEIFNKITIAVLKENRQVAIEEYESVKAGVKINAYVVDDPEEDAFQLRRRIEAYDLLLSDSASDRTHEMYDCDAVEWWDDKDE